MRPTFPLVVLMAALPLAAFAPAAPAVLDATFELPALADAVDSTGFTVHGTTSGSATGALRYARWVAFEPTIGVYDGTLFLSGIGFQSRGGTLGSLDWILVQRSTNGGLAWTDASPRIGPVAAPPQSNDPLIHMDADTGRIFDVEMQGLQCNVVSFSDDLGATWTTNPIGCGEPLGVQDHPTLWTGKPRTAVPVVGYTNVVYLCVNRVIDTACATSHDGGLSFGAYSPLVFQQQPANAECFVGGLMGHGAAAPDGTVYLGTNECGVPTVSYSKDDGLTWNVVTVSTLPAIGHDVEVSVDEAGNAYALWTGSDGLLYISVSRNGGVTWGPRILATPPGVNTAEFHTIAAGAEGRVAIAYYGTSADGNSGSFSNSVKWNAYLSVTTDALAVAPTFTTVAMNDPVDPIGKGPCNDDTRCGGVGDFIDVVIDENGRPWVALVDACRATCVTTAGGNSSPLGAVGTLSAGPALRGPSGGMLSPL